MVHSAVSLEFQLSSFCPQLIQLLYSPVIVKHKVTRGMKDGLEVYLCFDDCCFILRSPLYFDDCCFTLRSPFWCDGCCFMHGQDVGVAAGIDGWVEVCCLCCVQEWVWPVAYFLRAKLYVASKLERQKPGILKDTVDFVDTVLCRHYQELMHSPWKSLPELTNSNGSVSNHNCYFWSLAA